MITIDNKKLLTIPEVAEMTGMVYQQIYRQVILRKEIPIYRIGKKILIEKSDLSKLLKIE